MALLIKERGEASSQNIDDSSSDNLIHFPCYGKKGKQESRDRSHTYRSKKGRLVNSPDTEATKNPMKEETSSVPSIPIFTMPVRSHIIPTMAAIASGNPKVMDVATTEVVANASLR